MGIAIVLLAIIFDRIKNIIWREIIKKRSAQEVKEKIMSKIEIKNVYKIFGENPAKILPLASPLTPSSTKNLESLINLTNHR